MFPTHKFDDLQHYLNQGLEQLPAPLNKFVNALSKPLFEKIARWSRCPPIQKQWTAVQSIPFIVPSKRCFNSDAVYASLRTVSEHPTAQKHLFEQLQHLLPWRKGPFDLYGVFIDSEWKSYKKWDRLLQIMEPIAGKHVLDVGCGSGYYLWRAYGAGASFLLGIDPTPLFYMQYQAVNRLLGGNDAIQFLPVRLEDLPKTNYFDVVFSMGILYHRISPLEHLLALRNQLKSGGVLYLETLVHTERGEQLLFPKARYAKMRNVFFIPSPDLLSCWLQRIGFKNIVFGKIHVTSLEEQRQTSWIRGESLGDFLSREDSSKTCEGYPAPRRLLVKAICP